MSTRSGHIYRGRLTDQQRDSCITELFERVAYLETVIGQLQKEMHDEQHGLHEDPTDNPNQNRTSHQEFVYDFMQWLFVERNIN